MRSLLMRRTFLVYFVPGFLGCMGEEPWQIPPRRGRVRPSSLMMMLGAASTERETARTSLAIGPSDVAQSAARFMAIGL